MKLTEARIGYAPLKPTLDAPGDRRRFVFYADQRKLSFSRAHPTDSLDVAVLTEVADITHWSRVHSRVQLAYDLIDSYLALPRHSPRSLGRGLGKWLTGETTRLAPSYHRAIEAMCRRANAVVCSTREQREAILPLCPNVHVILDHHGEDVRTFKHDYRCSVPFRLVWEGLPHTLGAFTELSGVLREVAMVRPLEVHLITDPEFHKYAGHFGRQRTAEVARQLLPSFTLHAWSPDALSRVVPSCDLAVIPSVLDDPFSRGKPENKLLLLWRMGMATVTSATPAYVRAMHKAGLSLTCTSTEEWRRTLLHMIDNEDARAEAGRRGREYVAAHHSEQQVLRDWDVMFESLGFDV